MPYITMKICVTSWFTTWSFLDISTFIFIYTEIVRTSISVLSLVMSYIHEYISMKLHYILQTLTNVNFTSTF